MKKMKAVIRIVFSLLMLECVMAIHEYGHLKEFQKRNIPIKEFALGVGPRIWKSEKFSFILSVRLIPIAAYVEPTLGGEEMFEKQTSLLDKVVVNTAGVRNNLLSGLAIVLILQIFGWSQGKLTARELASTVVATPIKLILRFFAFLIGCVTWGHAKLAGSLLLSTGRVEPPFFVKKFIQWNLILGIANLVPIPPLDGGHTAQAILEAMGSSVHVPSLVSSILLFAFYLSAFRQDTRVLES